MSGCGAKRPSVLTSENLQSWRTDWRNWALRVPTAWGAFPSFLPCLKDASGQCIIEKFLPCAAPRVGAVHRDARAFGPNGAPGVTKLPLVEHDPYIFKFTWFYHFLFAFFLFLSSIHPRFVGIDPLCCSLFTLFIRYTMKLHIYLSSYPLLRKGHL